ncbi:hypothetical protein IV203_024211 [Nitzschia inconspicua]|uniref:Uncharacterized protein n=1 Tax=Nitzschia inconspicua TaxID=303405 RepID=A0A9K3KCY5_9STRA|nr:hypothetical protein IV203_024211 [Nitzschia inconspicua]
MADDHTKVQKDFPWHKPPVKENPPKVTWQIVRTTYKIYLLSHELPVCGSSRSSLREDTPLGALWENVVKGHGPRTCHVDLTISTLRSSVSSQ